MKKTRGIWGAVAGFLNGLLGSGGGLAAVPALKAQGLEQKQAHANAVALMLPLSAVSGAGMLLQGVFPDWGMLLPLTLGGLGGSLLGSFLLPKIPTDLLRRLFGILLIYGGVRMFW